MAGNECAGLLKCIQSAVRPLTDDRAFQLDRIEYGHYYGDVRVQLYSKDMDISFNNLLRGLIGVDYSFKVKYLNNIFFASFLIPALKLNLHTLDITERRSAGDLHMRSFYDARDYLGLIEYLMEKTAYIPELNQICIEIKRELPRIHRIFDPDVVDETIRLYVNEAKIQEPNLACFPAEIREPYREGVDKPRNRGSGEEERCSLKIEDIIGATDNLSKLFDFSSMITYYVRAGKIDVFFNAFRGNSWGLLYYYEDDGSVGSYFIPYYFNFTREEIRAKKEHIIFSGRNVFELLGIDYPQVSHGYLEDVREISRAIHDNISTIDEAFSPENVEKNYDILTAMEGNNEEIIKKVANHYVGIS